MNSDQMKLLKITFYSKTLAFELGIKSKPVLNSPTDYFCDMQFPKSAIEAYFVHKGEDFNALKLFVDLSKVDNYVVACTPNNIDNICGLRLEFSTIKKIELQNEIFYQNKDQCF